jgi:anthranilate synthase component 1
MRDELLESQKEQAENLMIVDLCRNDLATVSKTGSVKVDSLLAVESFSTVHQLVSTISGEIADGVTPIEVVRALFPAGSMTGAPKRSAVKILRNLESGQRGIYSGAHGFAGAGSLSLAMTIRSIVIDSLGASIGVGGGITADSKPEEEIVEVGVKAAALLSALGAAPNPYLHSE